MANDWYDPEYLPQQFTVARAEQMAGELRLIERGFERLPSLNVLYGSGQPYAVELSASAANAIVLESKYMARTDYEAGILVRWIASFSNTGAATVDVDGIGVRDIVHVNGKALAGGEIRAGEIVLIEYDGKRFVVRNPAVAPDMTLRFLSRVRDLKLQVDERMSPVTFPEAAGGTPPYTYLIPLADTPLPPGLSFASRVLSGTPTEAGSSDVEYEVLDSASHSLRALFRIEVAASLLELPAPDNYLVQVLGTFDEVLPAATGGTPPYAYSLQNLPPGLRFDATSRRLFGNPTAVGEYRSLLYKVGDADSSTAERRFSITVSERSQTTPIPQPSDLHRYVAVLAEGADVTAAAVEAGTEAAEDATSIKLPTWTGNRFILIAQPESAVDLTSVVIGFGNALSAFTKQDDFVTIDGTEYEVWKSNELQGDVISGHTITLAP